MRESKTSGRRLGALAAALAAAVPLGGVEAHHSFAMFTQEYVFTAVGEVVAFKPSPVHTAIEFAVLDVERTGFVMSEAGSPVIWQVELGPSAGEARRGVDATNFAPGTVFSIYLYPARDSVNVSPIVSGFGSARTGIANAYLVTCPSDSDGRSILPAPGQLCDALEGGRAFGTGTVPAGAVEWAVALRSENAIAPVEEEGSPLRPCDDRPFVVLRPDSEAAAAAAQDEDCLLVPNIGGRSGAGDSPVIRRGPEGAGPDGAIGAGSMRGTRLGTPSAED